MGRALYVYAIVRSRARLPRVAGRRIERVELGAVAAAAERRANTRPVSEKALRDQYRVVARLHEGVDAILPVRFGALVDEAELRRIVELRRRMLVASLKRVRGKSQMTVRLMGSPAEPARGAASTVDAFTGTGYLLSRAASSRPVISPLAENVRRAVEPIVSAESIDRGRGSIQLTINHLVPNRRVVSYRSRIEAAAAESGSVIVTISGPMPPFAFAPDLLNDT